MARDTDHRPELTYPEVHQSGSLGVSDMRHIVDHLNDAASRGAQVDVGVQIGADGRIWVCVDGMAFLRFKPGMRQMVVNP